MKSLLVLAFTLLFIIGCSEQKTETQSDNKDHVLRQQMDAMRDAEAVKQTLNKNTETQQKQAAEIAGH